MSFTDVLNFHPISLRECVFFLTENKLCLLKLLFIRTPPYDHLVQFDHLVGITCILIRRNQNTFALESSVGG